MIVKKAKLAPFCGTRNGRRTDGRTSPLEKQNKRRVRAVVRTKGMSVERRLLEMPITYYALTVLCGYYSLLLVTQIAVDERLM